MAPNFLHASIVAIDLRKLTRRNFEHVARGNGRSEVIRGHWRHHHVVGRGLVHHHVVSDGDIGIGFGWFLTSGGRDCEGCRRRRKNEAQGAVLFAWGLGHGATRPCIATFLRRD